MNFTVAFYGILVLYLVATLFYILRLILSRPLFSMLGLRFTIVAAIAQTVTLTAHVLYFERPFFTSYLDYFQTSSLILAIVFIVLCFTKRFYAAGALFITLVDVFAALSLTFAPSAHILAPSRGQGYLIFHLSAIFLSLTVFAIGLVSAVLFLIVERQIKHKRFSSWVDRLPPLMVLDDVHYKAIYVGFLLFTFAILTGAGLSKVETGQYIREDLKQVMGYSMWLFFAILLNFRVRKGWQGHKGVILSLSGFLGLILLYFVGLQ